MNYRPKNIRTCMFKKNMYVHVHSVLALLKVINKSMDITYLVYVLGVGIWCRYFKLQYSTINSYRVTLTQK